MGIIRQGLSVVAEAFTTVNDRWPTVILNTAKYARIQNFVLRMLRKYLKRRSRTVIEVQSELCINYKPLVKLQSKFIEIALWHGYSPVNLLHIFGTPLDGCSCLKFMSTSISNLLQTSFNITEILKTDYLRNQKRSQNTFYDAIHIHEVLEF